VLFNANDLKVDNSSLTGESEPQERGPLPEGSKARPIEAENLVCPFCLVFETLFNFEQVFNSTLILNGEGWGGKSLSLT
jgi:sodium/potassium-transporting ATPase subunit alpha